jgi:hypothetical protein
MESDDILSTHYKSALAGLKRAIEAVGMNTELISDIKPEYWCCQESYPCGGHGDAVISFTDARPVLKVSCGSPGMGAIMWYFGKGHKHFLEYIDNAFSEYLCHALAIAGPLLPLVTSQKKKPVVVPDQFKVGQDIDLLNPSNTAFVREILVVEKLNENNYKTLGFNPKGSYEEVAAGYGCDICARHSSLNNPIYTNSRKQGVDICSICVYTAFSSSLQAMPGWNPGPVYSLKEICQCNGKVVVQDANLLLPSDIFIV